MPAPTWTIRRFSLCGCWLLVAATFGGCAPAYYSYPCGCVSYHYGPPPPLPYTTYHGCPTPIASCWLDNAHGAAPLPPVTIDDGTGGELLPPPEPQPGADGPPPPPAP